MYNSLTLTVEDKVALITLNEPKSMNALSISMIGELNAALDEIAADESIRVVVLWGNEKLFGAGANINEIAALANAHDAFRYSQNVHALFDRFETFPKAVIAAIGGFALGGCLEMALSCDIRIASENAKLGCPEIKLAVLPGGGGTQRLSRLAGTAKAKEMLLTGDPVTADEALRIGIVNRVVPDGTLLTEAMKLASVIAGRPPIAAEMIKDAVNTGSGMDLPAALEHEAACFAILFDTEDKKEGVSAFLEKRKASFTGK